VYKRRDPERRNQDGFGALHVAPLSLAEPEAEPTGAAAEALPQAPATAAEALPQAPATAAEALPQPSAATEPLPAPSGEALAPASSAEALSQSSTPTERTLPQRASATAAAAGESLSAEKRSRDDCPGDLILSKPPPGH
jgi:hypothetical protein